MTGLRDYARQLGEMTARGGHEQNPYTLLYEHGQDLEWSEKPDGEDYGMAKQCYGNAGKRVLLGNGFEPDSDLTYYEGLILTADGPSIPIEHGWAVTRDGKVLEITLRHNDDECAFCLGNGSLHPADHWDYYGDGDDIEDEADIDCEFCEGSGKSKTGPRDLTGAVYLGVPIATEILRDFVTTEGQWGPVIENPNYHERILAGV